jgi:hypothetical protein
MKQKLIKILTFIVQCICVTLWVLCIIIVLKTLFFPN